MDPDLVSGISLQPKITMRGLTGSILLLVLNTFVFTKAFVKQEVSENFTFFYFRTHSNILILLKLKIY